MPMYLENYGPYRELIENKSMTINVEDITMENYEMHYRSIYNILLDLIETEYSRNVFITIRFKPDIECQLSIPDYWYNLIMWYCIISAGGEVRPKHIIFEKYNTLMSQKNYIDKFFLDKYIGIIKNKIILNNIIDDTTYRVIDVDDFSWYLSNTINLEDFKELEEENPRFREILHNDINSKDYKAEDINKIGLTLANESTDIIINSNHCLASAFRTKQGVNKKQYKESIINNGVKPNGDEGVFDTPINTSFLMGGVKTPLYRYIESSNGRTAQLILDNNVGNSGNFARILGLNNTDTLLHKDPDYVCDTKNYLKIVIPDDDAFSRLQGRYYRTNPKGVDKLITLRDTHLIGKMIYLRSPITCASNARGEGICYKCYGRLAYINNDINIGKLASELMSSDLTQKMLSAKHLLEAYVVELEWNKEFDDYFQIEFNIIKCRQDVDFSNIQLVINTNSINTDDESEYSEFNTCVDSFSIIDGDRKIEFSTTNYNPLNISMELATILDDYPMDYNDKDIVIPMKDLAENDICLFGVQILNNDLNIVLQNITRTINNKKITESMNKEELYTKLMQNISDGGLGLASVHAEVIISNQIRDTQDVYEKPDWSIPNVPYKVKALSGALTDNPSITIALSYARQKSTLYNPASFRKFKPSVLDVFFMEQPQNYLNSGIDEAPKDNSEYDNNGNKIVINRVNNKDVLKPIITRIKKK